MIRQKPADSKTGHRSAYVIRALALLGVGFAIGGLCGPSARTAFRRLLRAHGSPPPPHSTAYWAAKVDQFNLLNAVATGPSIVYLGDSITDWGNLDEYLVFDGGRVRNRGINGDTTAGVLRRLDRSIPKQTVVCFLMIGANDLLQGAGPADTAQRIAQICDALTTRHNVGCVVLESVLPIDPERRLDVEGLNARLRQLAKNRKGLSFLDLYSEFLADGQRNANLYADGIHPNARGMLHRLRLEVKHLRRVAPQLDVGLAKEP